MQLTAKIISQMLGGTVEGNPATTVFQPGKIEEGEKGSITFLANPKYEPYIYTTKASIVLVDRNFQPKEELSCTLIRVDDVYTAIAKLLEWYQEQQEEQKVGIAEKAQIHASAKIGSTVYIGDYSILCENVSIGDNCKIHAQVFIGKGVEIGANTTLHAGVKVYEGCQIGANCIIHANAVIGADGFGFAPQQDGTYSKVAQIGNVMIEDHVEIGANSTIDRATFGSTIIRKGVKIDNLVQIAHNVEIGENTVIAAQTGVAGSTKVGKNCMIGGQVGFAGHLIVADGAKIQAQSGIASNIKQENAKLFGSPAIPYTDYIKSYAVFKQLPKLYKKIYELEKKLEEQDKRGQD